MCGILAIIGNGDSTKIKELKKRGPDEYGFYKDKHIYLGHQRLSIVHPEAGPQPIFYNDWIVTMNGEIYNYRASVNETDCYIVPQLLEKCGTDGISQLDGIFSFVAYNKKTKEIVVARDAIGVTPLYYSKKPVAFSSIMYGLDENSHVEVVPPGTYAHFKVGENDFAFQKWTTPYSNWDTEGSSKVEIVPKMENAVRKRLMGNVPWGVLLSGGLDSTIVATIATNVAATVRPDYPTVHSFCIGLQDSPDIRVAEQVAKEIGTCHVSCTYTVEEGIKALPDVIKAIETYDLTTVRASTPMWILGKILKTRGIKMVLSGEGSDELFAGYLYNLYCPSEREMVEECKRKLDQLYAYDCLRANKTLGDWGVESRVPFLDQDIVDLAMNQLPPIHKLSGTHPDGPKAEKWWLRESFRDIIPDCVVDRTKAQFSDAVGNKWILALQEYAESQITDVAFAKASETYPYNTPTTKEAYLYREMFHSVFKHDNAEKTVLYTGDSIACSTGTASQWHQEFKNHLDPSGESIHLIKQSRR